MRQIGTVPDRQAARAFGDFLLTQGVKSTVEEADDGWEIWIYDEDHVDEARQQLEHFRENGDDARYRAASAEAEQLRRDEERKAREFRKNYVDVRTQWARPLAARAPVTYALILISVIAVVVTNFGKTAGPTDSLSIRSFRADETRRVVQPGLNEVLQGEVWRLVTPIFLHFTFLHILFNMLWLRELGSSVEIRRGKLHLLALIITIAVVSNLLQYWYKGPAFGGMSGVVFGLFGYVWMKSRFEPHSGFIMHPNTVFFMIAFFLLCFTGWLGPIANTAHGAGLATGLLVGYAPTLWRDLQRR